MDLKIEMNRDEIALRDSMRRAVSARRGMRIRLEDLAKLLGCTTAKLSIEERSYFTDGSREKFILDYIEAIKTLEGQRYAN